MDPEAGIDHRAGVFTHAAGADGVVHGSAELLCIVRQGSVGLYVRARQCLDHAVGGDRGGGKNLACQAHACDQDLGIIRTRQVVGDDDGGASGIGRARHDGAPAVWPDRADRDGHAGLAFQRTELAGVVAGGSKQKLQVGVGFFRV